MKKFIKGFSVFAIMIFMISILPFTALANDTDILSDDDKIEISFKITSGLDLNKEKESTFDKKRTISGTAKDGTMVTINVYSDSEPDSSQNGEETEVSSNSDYKEEQFYEIAVGASGIFSQTIYLNLGENTIDITVESEDSETIEKSFIINRKSREIKQELEKTIVLPGETQSSEKTSSDDTSNALEQLKK